MEIALTPDLEALIDDQIERGNFPTPGEVVRAGLRLLQGQMQSREEKLAVLRRDIQLGIDELEQGRGETYATEDLRQLAVKIKARGRERLGTDG